MDKIKVFAPKIWISGESCLINITDPIEHRMGNIILSKMRGDFLRSLASKRLFRRKDRASGGR